jgi:hypothetical protein
VAGLVDMLAAVAAAGLAELPALAAAGA